MQMHRGRDKCVALQRPADGGPQVLDDTGLENIAESTHRPRGLKEVSVFVHREEDHLRWGARLLQSKGSFDSTQDRHANIEDKNVRSETGGEFKHTLAVLSRAHNVKFPLKQMRDRSPHLF